MGAVKSASSRIVTSPFISLATAQTHVFAFLTKAGVSRRRGGDGVGVCLLSVLIRSTMNYLSFHFTTVAEASFLVHPAF